MATPLLLLVCQWATSFSLETAPTDKPGIYVIFDGSGSMWGALSDGTRKIEAAREVLRSFAGGDFTGKELALRVYGHRKKGDCNDTELAIPFSNPESFSKQIGPFLEGINPKGKTPITSSFKLALEDMGDRDGEIILISDGIETCDGDPCELIRAWAEKQVAIRVHVVGFGVDEKAKTALQCIALAAGTAYRDAETAGQLAEGLAQIQRESAWASVRLKGEDKDGNPVPVEGTLTSNDAVVSEVSSDTGRQIEAGDYQLTAGVRTLNGTLFQPVRKGVTVKQSGLTRIPVTVSLPPRVKAAFSEDGVAQKGALVTVYKDGKALFKFRPSDTVFMEPGVYEFRASPNAENQLSVHKEIATGQNTIPFKMTKTVHVLFRMLASGTRKPFRHNLELWQGDQRRYKVHIHNGARVLPGTYQLRMPHKLTPFEVPEIVITGEAKQEHEMVVPVGHVTVVYRDAEGKRAEDKRCFIGRGEKGKGFFHNSGTKIPLTPGTYNVNGWKGAYDPVVFDVVVGKDMEVVLQSKQ